MIESKTFEQARLDAINCLLDAEVKTVTVFFDRANKVWCVDREYYTEEEWEEFEDSE